MCVCVCLCLCVCAEARRKCLKQGRRKHRNTMTSPLHARLRKHISNRQTRRVRSMHLSLSQTHTNTHTPDMGHTLWPTSLISFIQPLRSLLSGSFSPSRLWSIHPPYFQLIRHVVTFVTLQRDSRFLWNVHKLACAQTQGRPHFGEIQNTSIDLILINDLSCTDFTVMCFG